MHGFSPCQIGRRAPAKWNTSRASQNTQRQYWTFWVHMQSSHGKQTVLVYDGEGAGSRSVLSAVESLRNSLSSRVQVAYQHSNKDLSPWLLYANIDRAQIVVHLNITT